PRLRPGGVVVQNVASLVSAGTERASVQTAQASLLRKIRLRPDLAKLVLDGVKRNGLSATYKKVQSRLNNYKELGYSSAGIVVDSSVDTFKPGDRVACAGTAHHAEYVFAPKNLVVRIPDDVTFEQAAFAALGAIALQGVRQADVHIGERVAVIGLGLIGLLTVQLLKRNGCRVIGLDVRRDNFALAERLGCDACAISSSEAVPAIGSFTSAQGADAVIVTASTSSNQPIELALAGARKRAAVVVVGDVGMNIPRIPFYEKELVLKIATSYGPGRYDSEYEEEGKDYPIGYVRWTENRNMQAVLDMIAQKKLDVRSLTTHKFAIEEGLQAYDIITGRQNEKYIGILIEYNPRKNAREPEERKMALRSVAPLRSASNDVVAGFIGAGNFAQTYLLPPLKRMGARFRGVATQTPAHAKAVGEKFGFDYIATDPAELFRDPDVNAIFIATRHDSHAQLVVDALRAGKHVFVEKPLAVTKEQLKKITETYRGIRAPVLMTGFNRRFSRPLMEMKKTFSDRREPLTMIYRVNAGRLPTSHWIYGKDQGGRIIGECCHFVDVMTYLCGSLPVRIFAEELQGSTDGAEHENIHCTITFTDGSVGTLVYQCGGDPSMPKESFEAHSSGTSAVMSNFDELVLSSAGKGKKLRLDGSKGHAEEMRHFVEVATGRAQPEISFESMWMTTTATFKILESLRKHGPVTI
ncbi:MAG: bi-domain-containing oxidoreductase, partial [Ignavibacteriales bacterium]|nr:bi-domain-containing oxidoreductase [Ignavibacteriales bacterium]